jgi:NADH oxidase (H2O2-forming)
LAKIRVVVVGGGVAGLVAADSARGVDSGASITVLSDEPHLPYRRPALPLIVRGCISRFSDINMFDEDAFRLRRIKYLPGTKAVDVDLRKGLVRAVKRSGDEVRVRFDRLILATGGRPAKPDIDGSDKRGVYSLRCFEDARALYEVARPGERAVVVGAGLVGLIISEALSRRGMKVRLVELRSQVLPDLFEPDLASRVERRVAASGVVVTTEATVDEITGGERVEGARVAGESLEASLVVLAAGVSPNVDLAKSVGIAVGRRGVLVDGRMQTSLGGVYAAGDCAETFDLVTGARVYTPVGSVAAEGGEVAGLNVVGREVEVSGFLRAQDERVFDLDMVSIGLTRGKSADARVKVSVVDLADGESFEPRGQGDVRVVLNSRSRVVGAQMIGYRVDRRRANALCVAVKSGWRFDELCEVWNRRFLSIRDFMEYKAAPSLRQW